MVPILTNILFIYLLLVSFFEKKKCVQEQIYLFTTSEEQIYLFTTSVLGYFLGKKYPKRVQE